MSKVASTFRPRNTPFPNRQRFTARSVSDRRASGPSMSSVRRGTPRWSMVTLTTTSPWMPAISAIQG